ncbi:Oxidoreductase aprR [Aspergillus parasiticus]
MTIKVIVVGAGGNLGPHIVSALDDDHRFTVTILARASSKSKFPSHITVHRVDDHYPKLEVVEAFKGQDVVISTVTTGALQRQKMFIDAAIEAGVKRFIPSEFGHDTRNGNASKMLPQMYQQKREIVEYLREKQNDGLEWTAFVTGPFLDVAIENFLGYNLSQQHATILNEGSDRWSATTRATVGLAVKNSLLIPEKTSNRYLFIDTVTVSQTDVLLALQKMTGTEWGVDYVDAEEQKHIALGNLSKGHLIGIPMLMRYITCVNGYGGNYLDYETSANEILSLPVRNVDEVITSILKD